VIGLSMGGALSLLFSTRAKVDGVVAMSTPYAIPTWYYPYMKPLIPLLETFMPVLKKSRASKWFNPAGLEDRFSYPVNPIRGAYELDRLLTELHRDHSKLTAPLLMIHSEDDDYIPIAHFMHYRQAFPQGKFIQISGANHLITQDGEKEKVFDYAGTFIEEHRNR
jgi:esterase/lipase